LGDVWRFRDLLIILMMRDVKLRYKQTALGVIWVILQPLVASLIFAVIFGRFANLPSNGVPYLLFVFAGLLLTAAFVVLRGINIYGDPSRWRHQASSMTTVPPRRTGRG